MGVVGVMLWRFASRASLCFPTTLSNLADLIITTSIPPLILIIPLLFCEITIASIVLVCSKILLEGKRASVEKRCQYWNITKGIVWMTSYMPKPLIQVLQTSLNISCRFSRLGTVQSNL
ncbi:hypothetical protein K402DRAFT_179999 [Aulographum hederae CBS 113979]|uniref:Uncharacterized protein n=1 Tax=Aulographum hederae CBS 113979 TaxID=1176131 RepID=A0A6G1GR25_9PEZI|nr:hypothetical protein K402DRAFT_179999 [Aulographum hederae CBS 113979]